MSIVREGDMVTRVPVQAGEGVRQRGRGRVWGGGGGGGCGREEGPVAVHVEGHGVQHKVDGVHHLELSKTVPKG